MDFDSYCSEVHSTFLFLCRDVTMSLITAGNQQRPSLVDCEGLTSSSLLMSLIGSLLLHRLPKSKIIPFLVNSLKQVLSQRSKNSIVSRLCSARLTSSSDLMRQISRSAGQLSLNKHSATSSQRTRRETVAAKPSDLQHSECEDYFQNDSASLRVHDLGFRGDKSWYASPGQPVESDLDHRYDARPQQRFSSCSIGNVYFQGPVTFICNASNSWTQPHNNPRKA